MISRALLVTFALLVPAVGQSDPEALVEKANSLYKQKNYDEAIAVYTKAIGSDPTNSKTLMFRALAKSMKDDWKGCIKDLNGAVKIDPEDAELRNTRAFAFLHTGDFEAARNDYRAIDAIEKDTGRQAQYAMAENLLRRARNNLMSKDGDREKALADYNRVLALAPANDIILFERACALFDLKQYEAALKDLDKAIEIDGDISKFGDTHLKRAKVRRALNDEDGAKKDEAEANRRSSR